MGHTIRSKSQTCTESEAFLSQETRLPWPTLLISLIVALDAASPLLTLLAH